MEREGEKFPKGSIIREGWLNHISAWLAIPSGAVLAVVMVLVTVDVLMRRFFNRPIAEVYDFAILGLMIATFCSIAWVMTVRGHIEADIIYRKYSPKLKRVIATIALFISAAPAMVMAWGSVLWMQKAFRVGETTLVLRWPTSPFIAVEIFGLTLLALVILVELINSFKAERME